MPGRVREEKWKKKEFLLSLLSWLLLIQYCLYAYYCFYLVIIIKFYNSVRSADGQNRKKIGRLILFINFMAKWALDFSLNVGYILKETKELTFFYKSVIAVFKIKKSFWKTKYSVKNLSNVYHLEVPPCKNTLSKTIINTNRMDSVKWTNHKERSFSPTYSTFCYV